ncbi:MAG TPA: hypothetical protein VJ914_20715 [Pseudonocardiaceae bacterium]|nr:hypothetical protein [Pseudonocardiaceae bacterium]
MSRQLFVETLIRCDLDALWQRTQNPADHQRWDLRFAPARCSTTGVDGGVRDRWLRGVDRARRQR